ncbi:MAG TPA: hypothetical protein V6D09_24370 [Leptolyngbyaceae cyanobacterium]
MKLNNRAFNSEPNLSNIELTESEIVDSQGTTWKQKYPRHIPVPQAKIDLKSPAVECSTGDLIDIEANQLRQNYIADDSVAVSRKNEVVLTKTKRQQLLEELNNVHLNNLRRNLEHRLQVAREKGDENLIRLLEAEFEQLG